MSGEGTWSVDNIGNVTFVPNNGYVGTAIIDYTVEDTLDVTSNIAQIEIEVLPDHDGDAVADIFDIDDDNDGIPDTIECGSPLSFCDTDGDGVPDYFDLDSDNDGLSDILEAGGAGLDVDNDGIIDNSADTDNDGLFDVADGDNGGTYLPTNDFDGDGHFDFQDLDSDNDGISDITESGGSDTDYDGVIDTFDDADMDGMDDNDMINDPRNSDGDSRPDHLDLDSDQDGIPDVVEAGYSDVDRDGRVDDFTDVNNDGWDDGAFGQEIIDTDEDGLPDYLDRDSDNDGISDVLEGGFEDQDDDQQIDNFEDFDSDGWDDNSAGKIIPDTDGDGIPDFQEIDSDNDGIPDAEEIGEDCDNDGLDNAYDADICDPVVIIPQGFTPNGDGINDLFVMQGIEDVPVNNLKVFNRYGNLVYEMDNYANDWDGTTNMEKLNVSGRVLSSGTFYYVFETNHKATGVMTGYVFIQRGN